MSCHDPELAADCVLRPRLLLTAARYGAHHYRRARHLPRIARLPALIPPVQAAALLRQRETEYEALRQSGDAGYDIAQHVELLSALMAETALAAAADDTRVVAAAHGRRAARPA